ncbi:MAG TPA: SprT family zinc-dependent metalloprotease [bacterium]|nr:SprT family zinc-dependent metalloprotease [bacterium]
MTVITYTLRRFARAKHVRIRIEPDGACVVTAPTRASQAVIDKLVAGKADWIANARKSLKAQPRPYSWRGTPAELKKFKSSALRLAQDRLKYFNQFYGFVWKDVVIRNQRTRWGSCSSTGRLSFTYKISLLPPHLADYIIVHELCHLKEMNHSKRFWALVAKTQPEYRQLKHQLHYGTTDQS